MAIIYSFIQVYHAHGFEGEFRPLHACLGFEHRQDEFKDLSGVEMLKFGREQAVLNHFHVEDIVHQGE